MSSKLALGASDSLLHKKKTSGPRETSLSKWRVARVVDPSWLGPTHGNANILLLGQKGATVIRYNNSSDLSGRGEGVRRKIVVESEE